jgi:hypothetical protein
MILLLLMMMMMTAMMTVMGFAHLGTAGDQYSWSV